MSVSVNSLFSGPISSTEAKGSKISDAPSLDHKNTERRLDAWLVSRGGNLAWARLGQGRLAESCGISSIRYKDTS